jgi:hypothetical protein
LKSKQRTFDLLFIKILNNFMESTKIDSELLTKLVEEAQIEKLTNPSSADQGIGQSFKKLNHTAMTWENDSTM